jgi:DNA-binding CsgD family transcriptional regulator/PAS domain-containing protein
MERPAQETYTAKSRSRVADLLSFQQGLDGRFRPPYQIRGAQKLYMSVSIDPDRVRPLLPPGLRIAASNTGILSVYVCNDTPVGPYAGSICGVVVEGFESPDGMEAVYWTGGYNDPNGLAILQDYTVDWVAGSGRIWTDGDLVHGESSRPDGTGALRFTMRRTNEPEALFDGAYHYLGRDQSGAAKISSLIGYARHANAGVLEVAEIATDAPAGLTGLSPVSLNWGVFFDDISMIMGIPRSIKVAAEVMNADAARFNLLALFDQFDQAALIVDADGRVIFVNGAAAELSEAGVAIGGRLVIGTAAEQTALRAAYAAVRSGTLVADTVSLTRQDDQGRLLAQVSAIDPRLASDRALLVRLIEPGGKLRKETAGLMRLLGLTASGARLASLVGGGISPRDAAMKLGITESTARTSMKVIFDKLRVARQSELARMVARLELL